MGGLLQSPTGPKSLKFSPSNIWNHPILHDKEAPGKLGPQVPYVSAKVRGYTYEVLSKVPGLASARSALESVMI